MKRNKWSIRNFIIIQCIILLLFFSIQGLARAEPNGFIAGFVKNELGEPLEKVLINIGPEGCMAITSVNGAFFTVCPVGPVILIFYHPEYKIFRFLGVRIHNLQLTLIDAVLERLDKKDEDREDEGDEEAEEKKDSQTHYSFNPSSQRGVL